MYSQAAWRTTRTVQGVEQIFLCALLAGSVANYAETEQLLSIDDTDGPLAGEMCFFECPIIVHTQVPQPRA